MNEWSADGWALLYDPAKFEKAGITSVPKTVDELLAACDKLTAAGFVPIYEFGSAVWHQPLWLNAATSTAKKSDPDYMAKFNANQLKLADVPEYELACFSNRRSWPTRGASARTSWLKPGRTPRRRWGLASTP